MEYPQSSLQSAEYYKQQGGPLPANFYGSSNFNNSYQPLPFIPFNGYDPKAMFNNHQFRNKGGLMDNNLEQILLAEEITEYHVQIDSKDRNPVIFPNPFKYKVTFAPIPNSIEKVNGKRIILEAPNPVIYQNFTNVRYIVLENAILPYFNRINKNGKVNLQDSLTDHMYIMLNIAEYQNKTNRYSTNDAMSEAFAVLYNDKKINETHYSTWSNNGIRIFPKDQLAKIDKWTISFQTPDGKDLFIGGMHRCQDIGSGCECIEEDPGDPNDPETFIEEYIDPECARHNLRHPMNRIFQHHLQFRVGVVEAHMNKKVFS